MCLMTQESWETYVKRVQHFFAANDVDDEHKVPTLLSLIGSKTYSILKDLLLPEKPADKEFDEIVSTLQKHLNPKPLEIAEWFRFYKRNQHEGESVLSYLAELRKLTTYCNFGSKLEETLRDRLVCRLSNEQIQTTGPVLIVRDWLHKLRLDWKTIKVPMQRNFV